MRTKDNLPLVSVVMATYNEPVNFISDSINSILNQSYSNFELIIVDDSTKPETISKIDELATDSRVTVIRDVNRMGFVKALNIGLKTAKGKYIARMDGDDISTPDRFSLQVSFLEQNPKYSVLGGAMNIMNNDGKIVSVRFYPIQTFRLKIWSIFRSPFAHPTVMFRKDIVDNDYFYDESFLKSEDLEFWMRLKKNGYSFANLKNVLLNYRIDDDFAKKRSGLQLKYSFQARLKNFSFRYPISGFLSLLVARFYTFVPIQFICIFYKNENSQKKNP